MEKEELIYKYGEVCMKRTLLERESLRLHREKSNIEEELIKIFIEEEK